MVRNPSYPARYRAKHLKWTNHGLKTANYDQPNAGAAPPVERDELGRESSPWCCRDRGRVCPDQLRNLNRWTLAHPQFDVGGWSSASVSRRS